MLPIFCLLFVGPLSISARAAEDAFQPVRHLANLVYISAKDMVVHGDEGHVDEIVSYGHKMIERAEALLEAVEALDVKTIETKKGKLIASVKGTLEMARKAVRFGRENNLKLALAAARKASFRAKQTRQRLQMIR